MLEIGSASHFSPKSTFIDIVSYTYLPKDGKKICERLSIIFCDGKHHEYSPPLILEGELFDMEKFFFDFAKDPSAGKFWHKNIKDKLPLKRLK